MASSSAGQALRLVIAWMWSMGWSGSYMEWTREDSRPWPSGWRTRMSASARREQMSVSSRAMTTARPASRSSLRPAGGGRRGPWRGPRRPVRGCSACRRRGRRGAARCWWTPSTGAGRRSRCSQRGDFSSPRCGDVLGVGVGVGGEGAGEHLQAGDEAVAVGHVLEQGAEAVDEGFLVLAVAQADAGALDLDGGGHRTAVGVQEDGDLVGAEGGGEPADAADARGRADLDLLAVEPGAGLHGGASGRWCPGGGCACSCG